jgi:flagellar hook assembly protein FlgD
LVFALGANIPNPFNPTTSISFDLSERCDVKLDVYNMLGKRVATLEDGEMSAGSYSVVWDGRDDSGRSVPTGIYLYRIEAGMDKASRRMILLK